MTYSISTVVPTYNEEHNVKNTVEKLYHYFEKSKWKYEIIIVDSNSKDNTPQIADELAKKYNTVKVIHQPVRKGYGNGIRDGFDHARYDLVWYMDADYPFDVNHVLPKAIKLLDNYDAVTGYRTGKKESLFRVIASVGYDLVITSFFGFYLKNYSFSFKLVKRSALKQLDLRSDGWFLPVELLVELKKQKFRIAQVPIPFIRRTSGESKVHILSAIRGLLKEIYTYKRR